MNSPFRETPGPQGVLARAPGVRHGDASPCHRHLHRMPFGPQRVSEYDPDEGYRFRLWAPVEKRVEVCLIGADGVKHYHPCAKSEGWHRCEIRDAKPGDLYAFRLDGQLEVPDPASRFNPHDVHGPSLLVDPTTFEWDAGWRGRPWEEAVIYELHVGTFTREGRYDAAERRLPELAELGITAIELMPLADFPGGRGWGYDGVLLYAPDAAYGTPDELKHFIQAAHRLGMMVMLDVVYNHFGPDGNYLHVYTPQFFTAAHATPWGGAIDFEGSASATVRDFYIHNALYWLDEYRFDGLRLDAVQTIFDGSPRHILEEISMWVRARAGKRHVHLVLENLDNRACRLAVPGTPGRYDAQWNDDFHHAAHVLLTGERDGYYADYADRPAHHLVRCLAEGFAYQGEYSKFHDAPRGEPSAGLPPTAFVNFLQNHDQIGNRAFGERLVTLADAHKLRALVAIQLLAPATPLLFMGEEAAAGTPFLYFCDYGEPLASAVRDGRKREFSAFERFSGGGDSVDDIPDPCAVATFADSKLDWDARRGERQRGWLRFYRELLALRRAEVVPRVALLVSGRAARTLVGDGAFEVRWPTVGGEALMLRANLADEASLPFPAVGVPPFASVGDGDGDSSGEGGSCGEGGSGEGGSGEGGSGEGGSGCLGPWSVRAYVLPPEVRG